MVIPLTHQSDDYKDFVIANTLFGGFFSSRLMSVIREEKGFTYGIYSSLTTYNSFSIFTISSEVKSETTKECIDEILHQIEILQNTPPDEEELQILKNYLSGEILDNTDGILKQDTVWKSIITKNLPYDYYNQFLQRIKTIQAEDISKVFQKYISISQLKKCVVGKMQ
jgi:predicted Zn-dependent peptidase